MTNHFPLKQSNMVWGVVLIVAGLLFLLQTFGLLGSFSALMWAVLFGAGGLFFLYWFLQERAKAWWAAIPGCVLLGLASVVFLDEFGPAVLAPLTGPLFLGAIGMGFVLIYLATPQHWWAIIPAGVMTTLALVAGVDEIGLLGVDSGAVLFIGLGVTFLVVGLLPADNDKGGKGLRWAFIPAAVLIMMGLLLGASFEQGIVYLWPLALIGGGLILIWRTLVMSKG